DMKLKNLPKIERPREKLRCKIKYEKIIKRTN
ncbi:unnamed protein product, partial [marine sediment metagenome]